MADPKPEPATVCCGHRPSRHVRGSAGKHYCIELGCRCGDLKLAPSKVGVTRSA